MPASRRPLELLFGNAGEPGHSLGGELGQAHDRPGHPERAMLAGDELGDIGAGTTRGLGDYRPGQAPALEQGDQVKAFHVKPGARCPVPGAQGH